MKRAALAAALAILFYIANRGAYQGYFSGDDIDSLAWTTITGWDIYYEGAASPKVSLDNFRPIGHLLYRVLGKTAGLHFPAWVAAIQALHLLNCILLWFVIRQLGLAELPALAATLFFSFHPALFDAFWKPMFLFDLTCCAFCLAAFLCYLHGRIVLAVLAFWLAMKSKEIAIFLPVVLAAYEMFLGERKWRRLAPFFAISLLFGTQAIWNNAAQKGPYRMQLTASSAASAAWFYAQQIFCSHWTCAGFAVLLIPAIATRERRVFFGLAAAALLLVPMLLFPGRAFAVYWYVPLTGIAIALAAAASNFHQLSVFGALAIWLIFSYNHLRDYRKRELNESAEIRSYVEQAFAAAPQHPEWAAFRYDGSPPTLQSWGVLSTWKMAAGRDFHGQRFWLEDGWHEKPLPSIPVFTWDNASRRLSISLFDSNRTPAPFMRLADLAAIYQLGRGWHGFDRGARKLGARATATLAPDPEASIFALAWRVDGISRAEGKLDLVVSFNGVEFGRFPCERDGEFATTWPVAKPFSQPVEMSLHVETPKLTEQLPAPEQLIWIESFGFQRATRSPEKATKVTMDHSGRLSGELARAAQQ